MIKFKIPNNESTFAAIKKEVDAVTASQVVFVLNKTHLSYSFLALNVLVIAIFAKYLYRRYKKKENNPESVQCEYVTLSVTENRPLPIPRRTELRYRTLRKLLPSIRRVYNKGLTKVGKLIDFIRNT